ncbi:hypothetical protein FRC01_000531 [Tulasnella sp. 417]|nr:hypothetical protein FRC01_000531 [Tulasnella sp. 417]
MAEYLPFDSPECDPAPDSTIKEIVQQPASVIIGGTASNVKSSSSGSLHISKALPVELLIEVMEQLATPRARFGVYLGKESLKTLVSLALVNPMFNGLVTPILYRRIRLATPSAIRSFLTTLSYSSRGTDPSNFVKHFLAYDPWHEATSHILAIITLIRHSVEYVHIYQWPEGLPGLELRDCLATVRSLRQLSVNRSPKGTTSPVPHFNNRSSLESIVLDDTNIVQVVQRILSDASSGAEAVIGPDLSIYCLARGTMPPWWVCFTTEEILKDFIATGRDLPSFRIVMFFMETNHVPGFMWRSDRLNLPNRWYCLPVPHLLGKVGTIDFDKWMCRMVEDGSLWETDLIPMNEWATWFKGRLPSGQDGAQSTA